MIRAAAIAALLTLAACDAPRESGPFAGPEAAVYDAARDRYLLTNVGDFGDAEDGYILALDPEGAPLPPPWAPAEGDPPLGNPLGLAIDGDTLYVADSPFVRRFDLATGAAGEPIEIPGAAVLNDVAVGPDGAVYVTDTGGDDPASWAVYVVSPAGAVDTLVRGEVLARPNGIDAAPDGRLYVAAMSSPVVVVLAADGAVVEVIDVPTAGNDGIVVLDDGFVLSSVTEGIVSRIGADGAASTLSDAQPSAASIGFDPTRRRIVVPQLSENTVSLLDLE